MVPKILHQIQCGCGFFSRTTTDNTITFELVYRGNCGTKLRKKRVSRPAKVTFTLEAGKTYQIGNPPQKKLEQAHAFAAKPDFWVVEKSTGEKITATVELSRPRTFLTQLRSAVTPVYEFESDRVAGSGAGEKTATKYHC